MPLPLNRILSNRIQLKIKMVRVIGSTRAWRHLLEVNAKNAKKTTIIIDNVMKVTIFRLRGKVSNNLRQKMLLPLAVIKKILMASSKMVEIRMARTTTSEGTTIEIINEIIIIDAMVAKATEEVMAKEIVEMMAKATTIIIIEEVTSSRDATGMPIHLSITRRRRRAGLSAKSQPQMQQKLGRMRGVRAGEVVVADIDRIIGTILLVGNPKELIRHLSNSTEINVSSTRIKGQRANVVAEVVVVVADEDVVIVTRTMKTMKVNLRALVVEEIEEKMQSRQAKLEMATTTKKRAVVAEEAGETTMATRARLVKKKAKVSRSEEVGVAIISKVQMGISVQPHEMAMSALI